MRGIGTAVIAVLVTGPLEAAQLTRIQVAAPAAMSSSCAGLTSSSGHNAGDAVHTNFPAELVCNSSSTSSTVAYTSSSATYTNNTQHVQADSQASATFGVVKVYADYSGPNSAYFPRAVATAGWVDGITIDAAEPGDTGTNGVWTFALAVEGDLEALAGFNTAAGIQIIPYVNDGMVATPSSFSVAGQGQQGFPYQVTVNQLAVFQVPIVFGTPFEFGLFASARAGTASQAGVDAINTSTADFFNTIVWAGTQSVTRNGNPVAFTMTSASGVDWTVAATPVPLPATVWPLLSALVLLGRRRGAGRSNAALTPPRRPGSDIGHRPLFGTTFRPTFRRRNESGVMRTDRYPSASAGGRIRRRVTTSRFVLTP